nr:hypothetical protein [Tanacetum cinerariifolium]
MKQCLKRTGISKSKKEKYKSLALKARKVSSDGEVSCSESDDEEYAMAIRDFKKFFRRRGKFVRQPYDEKKNFQKIKEDKKEKQDRRCFKCGDPNHFALYGLKQAPKAWYDRLKAYLLDNKYTMGLVGNTMFTKKRNSHIIIVQIYVDDIIFGLTCQDLCNDFSKIMHEEFEVSMMGELNFFLGLQIKQLEDGIFFNQSKYIKEMLKKFGLEDSKPIKTLMSSETKLTQDEDRETVDYTKCRGMICSILYLTASRSNIMFSVCLCARFQEAPKISHLEAVKRIFRYIKGTTHLTIWYPKGTGVETIVYADSIMRETTSIAKAQAVCTHS